MPPARLSHGLRKPGGRAFCDVRPPEILEGVLPMKKRIISYTLFFALILVMTTLLFPATLASATDYGEIEFGTTYTGMITAQNSTNRFTFVMPQPGRVTVEFGLPSEGGLPTGVWPFGTALVTWLSADGKELRSYIEGFPTSSSMDLEAGTYFIEVNGTYRVIGAWRNHTGSYSITVTSPVALNRTITAIASPSNGGTVTGGGVFQPALPIKYI